MLVNKFLSAKVWHSCILHDLSPFLLLSFDYAIRCLPSSFATCFEYLYKSDLLKSNKRTSSRATVSQMLRQPKCQRVSARTFAPSQTVPHTNCGAAFIVVLISLPRPCLPACNHPLPRWFQCHLDLLVLVSGFKEHFLVIRCHPLLPVLRVIDLTQ